MHSDLHSHARSEQGFTLIELLVVILIIGILAAVAIPTFLSQTSKASDVNVQSAIGATHTSENAYRASNGSYTTSFTALTSIEPTLSTPSTTYNMSIAYYATSGTASATTGYSVQGTNAKDGVTFYLKYDAGTGTVTKSCSSPSTGACSAGGTWGS